MTDTSGQRVFRGSQSRDTQSQANQMTDGDAPIAGRSHTLSGHPDRATLSIEHIVAEMEIIRVRYEMPDTSAFVRYLPDANTNPTDRLANTIPGHGAPVAVTETGRFHIPQLVHELSYTYIHVILFASDEARRYYVAGFDSALAQLEFIEGMVDFRRLWLTSGVSNLGIPTVLFLGQRSEVNGQPAVSIIDRRHAAEGVRVYRAVGGAGDHIGEEYY